MNNPLFKQYTHILEEIKIADQQAIKDFRNEKIDSGKLISINNGNLSTVKKIISEIGLPTIPNTSHEAYKSMILIALHSGDVIFLKEILKRLQNEDSTAIDRRDIAYITDKMRVIQNQLQLYGTQYRIEANGNMYYIEIEDPEKLEQRRRELGMESFEEYKKTVEQSLRSK